MTATELVIGQPVNWYGPGTVYTYRLGADGTWQERSRLTASDTLRMDDFGHTLALDGNTLLVGAPRKAGGTGVVYAFTRASEAAAWREIARITAPAGGLFGMSLALAGDDAFVGAPSAPNGGAVHHFVRQGGAWQLRATVRPATPDSGAAFGTSVSLQGDQLLIGAPGADGGVGRVYGAQRGADRAWSAPSPVAIPRAGAERAAVGATVLLDGARAFVGAPGAQQVHVLERSADGTWSAASELRAFDGGRGTQFGAALRRGRTRALGGRTGRQRSRLSLPGRQHRSSVGRLAPLRRRLQRGQLVALLLRLRDRRHRPTAPWCPCPRATSARGACSPPRAAATTGSARSCCRDAST